MNENASSILAQAARKKVRPDGSSYRALLFGEQKRLAEETGLSHKQIQMRALEQEIVPEVYARNQKSLTSAEQRTLLRSCVAVIGLGGLGGAVTEILARIGIGTLILVDGDRFEESNLNRQLLCNIDNLGRKKAIVAGDRVASINPAVTAVTIPRFFTSENGEALLAEADIVVDCLDDIPTRFTLERACRVRNIPMVTAAIGGAAGQVMVVHPEDPGLSIIYGDPAVAAPKGVETMRGTLAYAALTMAAIECAEVVALALGRPAPLRNRPFFFDLDGMAVEILDFCGA